MGSGSSVEVADSRRCRGGQGALSGWYEQGMRRRRGMEERGEEGGWEVQGDKILG